MFHVMKGILRLVIGSLAKVQNAFYRALSSLNFICSFTWSRFLTSLITHVVVSYICIYIYICFAARQHPALEPGEGDVWPAGVHVQQYQQRHDSTRHGALPDTGGVRQCKYCRSNTFFASDTIYWFRQKDIQ